MLITIRWKTLLSRNLSELNYKKLRWTGLTNNGAQAHT